MRNVNESLLIAEMCQKREFSEFDKVYAGKDRKT